MASGSAHGLVRTTTTATESRKMAAILQLISSQRHAPLVYSVFFDTGHPCYGQLTPVKNKVSADQYHVTISRA